MKKMLYRISCKIISGCRRANAWLNKGSTIKNINPGDMEAMRSVKALGDNVKVGRWTYVGDRSRAILLTSDRRVEIGKFCSIAEDVLIFAGGEHGHRVKVSTYPFKAKLMGANPNPDDISNGPVIIGNDVWIGSRAIILSGVTISNGAVIGAGAVVRCDVPPYAIVAGVPGKIVGYRFSEDIIEKLLAIAWWEWSDDEIAKKIDVFYGTVQNFVDKYYLKNNKEIVSTNIR
ncbi:MAG: CatB-related O-acetyltransferase [Candidatus Omnitrophota bacterium]